MGVLERDDEREGRTAGERPRRPEPDVDRRGSRGREEPPAETYRGYETAEVTQPPGKPWGFFLVLVAIVVVAAMYIVTMRSIPDIAAETAVGAMSGALALIGTLVGTYFGIKAGLDGQEKVKATVNRAVRENEERRRDDEERRRREERRREERRREERRPLRARRGDE